MTAIRAVLMLAGFVCLLAAGFGVKSHRVELTPLGLAFWMLAALLA
jgi:hypothetical protein